MLTKEQNERLTRVGPGTPGGELLRRYWQPFAVVADLMERKTKKVRVLGEDLALFRDNQGRPGLVAELCPHRRCSLAYGVPENEGIRCPYHGWLFDNQGNCLEQPAESSNSMFKHRIKTVAYPVQELGGLFWTYMGPGDPPILLRHDYLVEPNMLRAVGKTMLPVNWLQAMENSLDPTHFEWLHAWYGYYLEHGSGHTEDGGWPQQRHRKIGFDVTEYGVTKRRLYEGKSESDRQWSLGHPVFFPNILKVGPELQIRCIVDDEHTLHMVYSANRFKGVEIPEQEVIPSYDFPYRKPDGDFDLTVTLQQDMMAWVTQGKISDRTVEHLGGSDRGLMLFRKIMDEQMRRVELGEDPIGVFRDAAHLGQIDTPIDGEGRDDSEIGDNPRSTNQNPWNPIREDVKRYRLASLKAQGVA